MAYRCSDKAFLKGLKDYIYDYDQTPDETWQLLYKYLYVDDLYTYATQVFKGDTVERGVGNLNSRAVILLGSMQDTETIKLIKGIFSKINIDYNKLYVTSHQKAGTGTETQCNDILTRELKGIKPEVIFQIGDEFTYDNPNGYDIRVIPSEYIINMLSPANEEALKVYKKKFWVIIRDLIKYL